MILGYDGHGSTRVLYDLLAAVATVAGVPQVFSYDAYGTLLNMTAMQAATNLLYAGEMFDARVGLQNLRDRWYNPSIGRFNSLDSLTGNFQNPQSLHKYLYTHADPINGIDPSGQVTLSGISVRLGAGFQMVANAGVRLAARLYYKAVDLAFITSLNVTRINYWTLRAAYWIFTRVALPSLAIGALEQGLLVSFR